MIFGFWCYSIQRNKIYHKIIFESNFHYKYISDIHNYPCKHKVYSVQVRVLICGE